MRAGLAIAGLGLCCAMAGCGREVSRVDAGASLGVRVISLAPNLTEIIYAVGAGDRLVGRTDVCNWPPAVESVPIIGSFGRPALEAILRQHPTLVLTTDMEDPSVLAPLKKAGILHRNISCKTLDEIPEAIREVGRLVGADAAGGKLADSLAAEIEHLRATRIEPGARSAFVEIWGDPLMTAGRKAFVAELVRLAGCSNLADEVDAEYFTVSPEWVIVRDPEIIFCLYMSRDTQAVQRVAQRVGWQSVRAVRNGLVFDGFNTDLIFRPGPRVMEGVAEIRSRLEKKAEASP